MQQIKINNLNEFDINHILLCGQIFRFEKLADNDYVVYSADKRCRVIQGCDSAIIECDDTQYFNNYFDLDRDYTAIKNAIEGLPLMSEATKNGFGIRILNQNKWEMLISFIISANNHIPRIKGIIERLCNALGDEKGGYHAFPTPQQMAQKDEQFYAELGAGYRARYLALTAKAVAEGFDLDAIDDLDSNMASKKLCELYGVGAKVADCILLFAYHRQDVFPVDTWIRKVYADIIEQETNSYKKNNFDIINSLDNKNNFDKKNSIDKKNVIDNKVVHNDHIALKTKTDCNNVNDCADDCNSADTLERLHTISSKNKEVSGSVIRRKLVGIYGQYSGYAQQYLFFNKRGQ